MSQAAENQVPLAEAPVAVAPPAAPPAPQLVVDDSQTVSCYANFCRVTGTPEELILDFGLDMAPMAAEKTVSMKHRIVTNYFTAKRMLAALSMSLQRHEAAFGVLETDVTKRVIRSR
jgi:hypothetical protein